MANECSCVESGISNLDTPIRWPECATSMWWNQAGNPAARVNSIGAEINSPADFEIFQGHRERTIGAVNGRYAHFQLPGKIHRFLLKGFPGLASVLTE